MDSNGVPENLYHYTSIDTLKLILTNRTIRFSCLTEVDDLEEAKSADIVNIGQINFVSCWTADEKESIPMWSQYASFDNGVMIKLPTFPFKKYKYSIAEIAFAFNKKYDGNENENIEFTLPVVDLLKENIISPNFMNSDILYKVIYTDDEEKIFPQVRQVYGTKLNLNTEKIGIFKRTDWAFQNEWRYKLSFMKTPLNAGADFALLVFNLMVNSVANGVYVAPFKYYDMKISDDAFSKMEITLSPKITEENSNRVKAMVIGLNPSAKIHESKLQGKIR